MAYMPYNKKGEQMIKFEVLFFEEDNGKVPVEEFLDGLDKKMRAKLVGLIEVLQEWVML